MSHKRSHAESGNVSEKKPRFNSPSIGKNDSGGGKESSQGSGGSRGKGGANRKGGWGKRGKREASGKHEASDKVTQQMKNKDKYNNRKGKGKLRKGTKQDRRDTEEKETKAKPFKTFSEDAVEEETTDQTEETTDQAEKHTAETKEKNREIHEKRKQHKEHNAKVDLNLAKLKQLWEKARLQDLNPKAREEEINKMMKLIGDYAKDYVYKSGGSRILQTVLKYGTTEHRQAIISQVINEVLTVIQHDYSHFLIQKLYFYGNAKQRSEILNAMQGHVVRIFRSKFGAKVIEAMYKKSNSSDQRRLLAEFYGRELALFQSEASKTTLSKFLDSVSAEKKQILLNEMKEKLISILSTKGEAIVGFSLLHKVLWDYFCNADTAGILELVSTLSNLLIYFMHTRDGARVAAYCFRYGDVRVRKAMLKSMKEHVSAIVFSPYAFTVVLTALACVDDTSLSAKTLLTPLVPSLYQVAIHPNASRVLISILVDEPTTRYFTQQDIDFMTKTVMVPSKEEGQKGRKVPSSLKNPAVRRTQLREVLLEPLQDMCAVHLHQLLVSRPGAEVVSCVYQLAKAPILKALHELVESTSTDPAEYNKKKELGGAGANDDTHMKEADATTKSKGVIKSTTKGATKGKDKEEEESDDENDDDDDDDEEEDDDKANEDDSDEDEDEDEDESANTAGTKEEYTYWTAAPGTKFMTHMMKEDDSLVEKLANAFKGNFAYWATENSNASYLIRDILLKAEEKTRKMIANELQSKPSVGNRINNTLLELGLKK